MQEDKRKIPSKGHRWRSQSELCRHFVDNLSSFQHEAFMQMSDELRPGPKTESGSQLNLVKIGSETIIFKSSFQHTIKVSHFIHRGKMEENLYIFWGKNSSIGQSQCSGVARRRKVWGGGHKLFFQKSEKQKKKKKKKNFFSKKVKSKKKKKKSQRCKTAW